MQVGPITLTILGNKCDMVKQQAVSEEETRGYAESIGAEHHYVSAKTGEGISAAVRQTVHRVLQHRSKHAQQHPPSYLPGELAPVCITGRLHIAVSLQGMTASMVYTAVDCAVLAGEA